MVEHVLFELHLIGPTATAPPSLAVARLVDRDSINPGLQRRLPAKRGQGAEDPQEHFLRQVERFITVAKQMQGELEHHPLVTGDQLGTRGLLAGGAALNQRGLAGANLSPPKGSRVFHQLLGDES